MGGIVTVCVFLLQPNRCCNTKPSTNHYSGFTKRGMGGVGVGVGVEAIRRPVLLGRHFTTYLPQGGENLDLGFSPKELAGWVQSKYDALALSLKAVVAYKCPPSPPPAPSKAK